MTKLSMLSIQASKITIEPGSTSPDKLSPAMVAGALAMGKIPESASFFAYAVLLNQPEMRQPFIRKALYALSRIYADKKIKPEPGTITYMVKLAMWELTPELSRCPACKGVPDRPNKKLVCSSCGGTGRAKLSSRQIQALTGINRETWRRKYRGIYHDIVFPWVLSQQDIVVQAVKRG